MTRLLVTTYHAYRRLRASPAWRAAILAVAILAYALASLWPLNWNPPHRVANGAVWTADGGLSFPSEGLAVSRWPPAWLATVTEQQRIEIELRARSFEREQRGQRRILTISDSSRDYNLFLGQRNRHLILRLYRTCRHVEQLELPCEAAHMVKEVFADPEWHDIRVAIQPLRVDLWVDGVHVYERPLSDNPLAVWQLGHHLAIGNEVGGNLPWLGEISRAVMRTPGLEVDLLDPEAFVLPAHYWYVDREPILVPFKDAKLQDVLNNIVFYVPLGVLLALLGIGRGRFAVLRAGALLGLVSLSMETAQLFASSRNPSITDLILNIGGGTAGFALVHFVSRGDRIGRLLQPVAQLAGWSPALPGKPPER